MNHDSFDQPTSFGLPRCPYCGKRLNPFVAWLYKTKGEYACPNCSKISSVTADSKVPIFGVVAIALSIIVFILFLIFDGKTPLWGVLIMVLPFLAFTMISPFLVRLEPERAPQKVKEPQRVPRRGPLPKVSQQRPAAAPPRVPQQQNVPRQAPAPQRAQNSNPNPYSHPASRPPESRGLNNNTARRPAQQPARGAQPNLFTPPPQRPPVPGKGQPKVQTNRPPVGRQNPVPSKRTGANPSPKLFDTAEFGKRSPKDFSGYQDK